MTFTFLNTLFFLADGNGFFPVVMVGGVLEANRTWDIGKEAVKCIQEQFPGAHPIRPQVSIDSPFILDAFIPQQTAKLISGFAFIFFQVSSIPIVKSECIEPHCN
jgi:hypothetical protein